MLSKNLMCIIYSYLPLEEIYDLAKDNLYQSHKIIDYTNMNMDNLELFDYRYQDMGQEGYSMSGVLIFSSFKLISLISYKNHMCIIRGPKLYTKNGIIGPEYQYTTNDYKYIIRSNLNVMIEQENKLLDLFKAIHITLSKLIIPYHKLLGLINYDISSPVPPLISYKKDQMTVQPINGADQSIYWC